MSKTLLIIISGPPCSGKTTLGQRIAEEFRLPIISKDDIKESLFDRLGVKDREWSKKLGIASYDILYDLATSLLKAKRPFILESNFKAEVDTEKFLDLKNKHDFLPFQIQCKTNGEILFERFKERSESGDRHPGHVDHLNYEEFKDVLLKGAHDPLEIGGKVFDIDTTEFQSIDYKSLFEEINTAINST